MSHLRIQADYTKVNMDSMVSCMKRQLTGKRVRLEDQMLLQLQLNTTPPLLLAHEHRRATAAEAEQLLYIGVLPTGGQAHFLTEQSSAVPQMPLQGP